jgi:hypothetical protein
MASEFAIKVLERIRSGGQMAESVDAELREVREVLSQFEEEWMTPHDYEHEIGEIPKDVPCDQCELSQRARALMEKLEVK